MIRKGGQRLGMGTMHHPGPPTTTTRGPVEPPQTVRPVRRAGGWDTSSSWDPVAGRPPWPVSGWPMAAAGVAGAAGCVGFGFSAVSGGHATAGYDVPWAVPGRRGQAGTYHAASLLTGKGGRASGPRCKSNGYMCVMDTTRTATASSGSLWCGAGEELCSTTRLGRPWSLYTLLCVREFPIFRILAASCHGRVTPPKHPYTVGKNSPALAPGQPICFVLLAPETRNGGRWVRCAREPDLR